MAHLNLFGDLTMNEDLMLQKVLSLLGPRSLVKIANVNSIFESMANDDILWKDLLACLWQNKMRVCTGNELRPKVKMQPYRKIFLNELGYKTFSALQLKYILKERHVNVRGCNEKSEFINLALSSQSPVICQFSTQNIPRPFCNKWKASFYISLRDGHRTRAIKADICTYKWKMRFKNNPAYPDWESSFHNDLTLTSVPNPNPGVNMTWCFYGQNDEYVRVGQYPPLIISRLPDWGWRMENQYVYFFRTDSLN